jgi:hypothetical protein
MYKIASKKHACTTFFVREKNIWSVKERHLIFFLTNIFQQKKKRLVGVGPNKMRQLDWLDLLIPTTPGLSFFFFFFFYIFF